VLVQTATNTAEIDCNIVVMCKMIGQKLLCYMLFACFRRRRFRQCAW